MPIQFRCPKCEKETVVADQFAGQTGPCANCGAMVTIPGAMPAYGAPSARPSSGGGASVVVIILAALAVGGLVCAGILAALLLPAIQAAREAARRSASMNNMKQLSLALMNYESTYGQFPPAVVTDSAGQPLYSGRVLLLPFIEQNGLYQQFDKNKAWDSPENLAVSQTAIQTFCDPSSGSKTNSRSDYVFVTGQGTMFEVSTSVRMFDVKDGMSNTITFIETAAGPSSWAEPKEWNADSGQLPKGNHPTVVLVTFADGSVRAVSKGTDPETLKRLAQKSDGQVIPDF